MKKANRQQVIRTAIGLWHRVAPYFAQNGLVQVKRQRGKVVYIHPRGRYVTLEFPGHHGRPRECFRLDELGEPVAAPRKAGA